MIGRSGSKVIKFSIYLITFLFLPFITSCVSLQDSETSQELNSDIVGIVTPNQTVGQSFISRRSRLDGVKFWLETDQSNSKIRFELFHTPQDTNPIFSGIFSVQDETKIEFPAQPDLPNQTYYMRISTTEGEIRVLGRDEDNFYWGTAFINDKTIDADLAFRTTYDYDWRAVITDLKWIAGLWWLALPLGIFLFAPGWLLIDLSHLNTDLDFGSQIALSLGISLAIVPVRMLWTSTLGIKWRKETVWVTAGILLILIIWRVIYKTRQTINRKPQSSSGILLTGIFAITLFTRFAMVRDLSAPAWVDSIHHAIITQDIIESGAIPENYLPHIPDEASQYHPGFHINLSVFLQSTGLDITEGMLIYGQILNALMIFPVYFFTVLFTKNQKVGLWAALITGMFTLMPAYYTSWGRYTQLAGLLILPAAMFWIIQTQKKGAYFVRLALGSITIAGLFLTHYRVALFFGCLIISWWISLLYGKNAQRWQILKLTIRNNAILIASSILVALPWVIPTITKYTIRFAIHRSGAGNPFPGFTWRYLTPALGSYALILAGLGLIWGIAERRKFSISILVWVILLFGIAKPNLFGIPHLPSFVNQTSVEIMLFIPIAGLGGYFLNEAISKIVNKMPHRWQTAWLVFVMIFGIGISILGAQRLLPTLNPTTLLYRNADRTAIEWIAKNIPKDETIVINPTGWGYGLYRGNDGGYWISPITNRQTMPPNVLYGTNVDQHLQVNSFVENIIPVTKSDIAIWNLLNEYDLDYIYIGGRGGILSPRTLEKSEYFETIFNQENTWVFHKLK